MPKTDEILAKESAQGDDASFQELMRRFLTPVFNFSRQYVRAQAEAEDITQDTFLKVWKNIKKFNQGQKFKPWIFTIARNTALDHIRKRKAIPFSEIDTSDEYGQENSAPQFSETLEDLEPIADELFEQTENTDKISVALEILRPEYRSVLMLHYAEDLTFEEIAIVMNNPMNTVKSWHRRALEILRNHLHQN